jgi:CIC family chloride channel protein
LTPEAGRRTGTARRVRFAASLGLVALGAALFAVAFRLSLSWLYAVLYQSGSVVDGLTRLPPSARFLVPVAGAAVAGWIIRLSAAPSQGVSNVMEAVVLGRMHLSLRATASRVSASWAAIAGGMSIGREGPLIEFGGSLAASVGRRLGTSRDEVRVLVAAGTAAGFAAAYNTPFAAVVFVLETIVGLAAPKLVVPVMIASVVAAAVTRAAVGAGPIYGQRSFGLESSVDLVSFAALGAVAAIAAVAFKQSLAMFERLVERRPVPQPLQAMIAGALVGAIAIAIPDVIGNGYEPLNAMLDFRPGVAFATILIIAKVLATSGSVAAGVPGGIFTPMLLVGACLGAVWAQTVGGITSPHASIGSFMLIGMAAATAASIHAPLTAAVMIFELSGDYLIVLPLLLATSIATTVSYLLGSESVYTSELRKRGLAWDVTLEGHRFKDPFS